MRGTDAGGRWCLGLAMANGRCRLHGGASTGPRTAAGLARIVAAKTTHGRFAAGESPKRLARGFVRTPCVRIALTHDGDDAAGVSAGWDVGAVGLGAGGTRGAEAPVPGGVRSALCGGGSCR